MKKIDSIYDAVDEFGLITSFEARRLGVSNAEMVQFSRRGKLARVARGVYQMPVWPFQSSLPFAIAVKSVGVDAYLYGESVIALLGLVPTDPTKMWVASTSRVRRQVGTGIQIVDRKPLPERTCYDGVPAQPIREAVVTAVATLGRERALQAALVAQEQGYLSKDEAASLKQEIGE
ncbi:type IV toxin-antitoxin system AbiEi family antitoxin domain-containing protein [Boudabousia marimammalium]|uniref:AbiEi antitoxin N-terminal domain-containing protein n=1 Tax=Boudabousia marimammalium TaxID=156892 RepID=A0A1Q5PS27_9ACTO|nr:type IV toxin-antitoxin system AbiEi family antitoxin domain-containing protein [Boudabousia marimammalium]OKL50309.1 hypothetical protein BM477_02675 [Boudabousia marimammalium]